MSFVSNLKNLDRVPPIDLFWGLSRGEYDAKLQNFHLWNVFNPLWSRTTNRTNRKMKKQYGRQSGTRERNKFHSLNQSTIIKNIGLEMIGCPMPRQNSFHKERNDLYISSIMRDPACTMYTVFSSHALRPDLPLWSNITLEYHMPRCTFLKISLVLSLLFHGTIDLMERDGGHMPWKVIS